MRSSAHPALQKLLSILLLFLGRRPLQWVGARSIAGKKHQGRASKKDLKSTRFRNPSAMRTRAVTALGFQPNRSKLKSYNNNNNKRLSRSEDRLSGYSLWMSHELQITSLLGLRGGNQTSQPPYRDQLGQEAKAPNPAPTYIIKTYESV